MAYQRKTKKAGPNRPKRVKGPGRTYVKSDDVAKLIVGLRCDLGYSPEQIAERLGIHVGTLTKYYRAELAESKDKIAIAIIRTMEAKCLGGTGRDGDERDWRKADTTALIFYLKTQRGWRERTEIELNGGLTIKIGKEFKDL